jgi:hypothetical protein
MRSDLDRKISRQPASERGRRTRQGARIRVSTLLTGCCAGGPVVKIAGRGSMQQSPRRPPPPAGRSALGPLTVVPADVTYSGMPASRLWAFEDGRVNLAAVDALPEDLGRLLLAGFGVVYGADSLLVPLEAAVGTLVRITRLDVCDTVGRTVTVGPTAPRGRTAREDHGREICRRH